jgi:hypothetical protein
MKKTACLSALIFALTLMLCPPGTMAQEASGLGPKYGGMLFAGPSDPQYRSYEQAIKPILLDQIEREYGVVLNGERLSPEELLEINALLRLKRSDEPVDYILNRFPGALAPETPS